MEDSINIESLLAIIKERGITSYEIAAKTSISEAGARKLLNGMSKNPRESTIRELQEYLLNTKPGVPYYDIEITGTVIENFTQIQESPDYYIDYRPFNDCDAYLPIYGESMYPEFRSGEVLAVKRVRNFDAILWGEAHLVITKPEANEMKTVKYIHPSDNNDEIILRASNPKYSGDTILKKSHILSMYIVKGKICRKQM